VEKATNRSALLERGTEERAGIWSSFARQLHELSLSEIKQSQYD
jgi:hypothetical protein